eukprot:COSAG06_NODE_31920_length_514_cov_0.532530_1_plen_77_part_10
MVSNRAALAAAASPRFEASMLALDKLADWLDGLTCGSGVPANSMARIHIVTFTRAAKKSRQRAVAAAASSTPGPPRR